MCILYNIRALHHNIQLQLRTYIYMAIVCTYQCRDDWLVKKVWGQG